MALSAEAVVVRTELVAAVVRTGPAVAGLGFVVSLHSAVVISSAAVDSAEPVGGL